jgi:hypothetical protein
MVSTVCKREGGGGGGGRREGANSGWCSAAANGMHKQVVVGRTIASRVRQAALGLSHEVTNESSSTVAERTPYTSD